MRVDPNLTNPTASPLVACAANYNALCADGSKSAGISSATAGVQVITPGGSSQYAAVIFISHGATGYGSYMAQAAPNSNYGSPILFPSTSTYPPCSPPVGYAQCNSAHNTLTKVYNAPEVVGAADPSDDILTFASRNILVSMFGNASCPTNCNW
jgi:hypothetical protein